MAADPFAALGLVGNIITFVDFTWKLLAGAHAIYRSSSGTSEENTVLQAIAADVKCLSDAVVVEQAHSEDLRALARESKRVAGELLDALEKLKVKSPRNQWASLKVALKDAWSRDQVDSLEQRLSKLQAQVTARVQHLMGNKMSEISVAVNSLVETNNLLRLDMKKLFNMDSMIKDIVQATKVLQFDDGEEHKLNNPAQLQALSRAISSLGAHGRTMAYEQDLLGSLHFVMIQARHETIDEAHADTYEWIYWDVVPDTAQPIRFVQWLEQGNGIFWVHGKPGCGKSTLMKFICNHALTHEHLSHWTERHSKYLDQFRQDESGNESETKKRLIYESDLVTSYHRQQSGGMRGGEGEISKLVTAKYFFWNAGFKLQKSQEGLLRSLLFDVLRQCPELVGHVRRTRSRYSGFTDNSEETALFASTASWSFEELLLTIEDVISVRISATFCLFIDGLDEYEEENKRTYRHLINTLNCIAKLPNAKICTSSRPWTVFLDAFKDTAASSLRLEDLTRGDIRRYVLDKFEAHDQYPRLRAHDPGYEALVEEVATRAQGVFLWVYLVVKDLLEGFTYNDSVQTMRQRLDQFPDDLEDFFMHMIECIPPLYRRQAARTFIITMEAPHPLLLTLHSFLDDIEADPTFCVARSQSPFGSSDLAFRFERMRRQLEGRTKGLLEVFSQPEITEPYFATRVDFLHRTVRDFLQSSRKVQSFMMCEQEGVSKIWVTLCRGILAQIRYAPFLPPLRLAPPGAQHSKTELSTPRRSQDNQRLDRFLFEFMYFAEKALHDANNANVIITLFKAVEGAIKPGKLFIDDSSERLAKLVCKYGLLEFLKHMDYDWSTLSDPLPTPTSVPLIRNALIDFAGPSQRQHDLVAYLLSRGADPNQQWTIAWKTSSTFQQYMVALDLTEPIPERESHHIFQIVMTLVAHGANLSARIEHMHTFKGDNITARDVIRRWFGPQLASRILDNAPQTEKRERQRPSTSSVAGPPNPGPETRGSNSQGEPQPQPQPQPQSPGRRAMFRSSLKQLFRRSNGQSVIKGGT